MADFNRESKTFAELVTFTRASTGTYYDAQGVLQTAAVDEQRLTHDPETGEALGLLIEEQRTNLLLWSEAFDDAAWTKQRATITNNAATAPDGTLTADKLVEDDSLGTHNVLQDLVSAIDGQTYTDSIYVKAAGRNRCRFNLLGTAIPNIFFSLDLTLTESTSNSEYLGDGWHRVFVSETASGTGSVRLLIQPEDDSGTATYQGDGTSGTYIWGAQLEAGAFPTSYIKTEGAQVTRAEDNASVDTLTPWFNAAEFTLSFIFSGQEIDTQGFLELYESDLNGVHLYATSLNNLRYLVQLGGAAVVGPNNIGMGDPELPHHAAVSLNSGTGGWVVAVDGASVSGSADLDLSALTSAVVNFFKYSRIGSSYQKGGTAANFKSFPRALTATELQELTAP